MAKLGTGKELEGEQLKDDKLNDIEREWASAKN